MHCIALQLECMHFIAIRMHALHYNFIAGFASGLPQGVKVQVSTEYGSNIGDKSKSIQHGKKVQ